MISPPHVNSIDFDGTLQVIQLTDAQVVLTVLANVSVRNTSVGGMVAQWSEQSTDKRIPLAPLGNFDNFLALPTLPVSFGRDTKIRRSLLMLNAHLPTGSRQLAISPTAD